MKDEYRKVLIELEQKSQNDYDKSIISLASGALGLSLFFYRDVIGENEVVCPSLLTYSWWVLAASIVVVVISFYLNRLALRKALIQHDSKKKPGVVGGLATCFTNIANALSGLLFLIGIGLFIQFASQNI